MAMEEKLIRMIELLESMNLPMSHATILGNALGHLAVAAQRLGVTPEDEKDLTIFVIEFIIDARSRV